MKAESSLCERKIRTSPTRESKRRLKHNQDKERRRHSYDKCPHSGMEDYITALQQASRL